MPDLAGRPLRVDAQSQSFTGGMPEDQVGTEVDKRFALMQRFGGLGKGAPRHRGIGHRPVSPPVLLVEGKPLSPLGKSE